MACFKTDETRATWTKTTTILIATTAATADGAPAAAAAVILQTPVRNIPLGKCSPPPLESQALHTLKCITSMQRRTYSKNKNAML